MISKITNQSYKDEILIPEAIKKSRLMGNKRELLKRHETCVSFNTQAVTEFQGKGSYVLLDFGKELCGGIRIITSYTRGIARFHFRFGESITEAVTDISVKNSCNDHSPRDFEAGVPSLADLTFGQTGFRFVYIELISENPITVQGIFAVNHLPEFKREAEIITNDELLNKIIKTAAYTVKLCCQNNYIVDGIKRDRLIWSGDMHPEMLSAFYFFGDIPNIKNSLLFIKNDTDPTKWVNWIPSYSAWWIINFCDYCKICGNRSFLKQNASYGAKILEKMNSSIDGNGNMTFEGTNMPYFLDWPTNGTPDAVIGTASLFLLAAKRYLDFFENADAQDIVKKLTPFLNRSKPVSKQAYAFRYLAVGKAENLNSVLEHDGSCEFSTFMAYYILKADALSGGTNMLSLIKEYYGGMLQKGATTFWEDFDITWIENTNAINRFPKANERDIHGDFGKFCYQNFRHSLCHGWSAGVLAFVVENILGIKLENNKIVDIKPNLMGLTDITAKIPVGDKWLKLKINGKQMDYSLSEN